MDIRKIKKLIDLLEKTGIAEIEIKEGEESVRLSRNTSVSYIPEKQHIPVPMHAEPPIESRKETKQTDKDSQSYSSEEYLLRSPMVGTMYVASSPEALPFVKVGQSVKVGETLCIIEAMKMFNEIESDRNGVITKVHLGNGDPVEFDQPLFTITEG